MNMLGERCVSLSGGKESSENLAKMQDLAYRSKSLKVRRAQQQEKRLGPASSYICTFQMSCSRLDSTGQLCWSGSGFWCSLWWEIPASALCSMLDQWPVC